MAKEQRYCATDEILEAAFGRFHFEDWKGLTEGAKKKMMELPDYIRERIYEKGYADAHDAVELMTASDKRRTDLLKRFTITDEAAERAAAENPRFIEAVVNRQKGQILPKEAAAAANIAINQRLESMADNGFEFAEIIRKGGDVEGFAGMKQLVEVTALVQQLAGNQSEAGRLLAYSRKIKEDRSASKELITLFGRFGC